MIRTCCPRAMLGYIVVRGYCRHIPFTLFNIRKMSATKAYSSLSVVPRDGLVDEPVIISVTGLSPKQPVTVHARLVENGMRLSSYGHFIATPEGSLDLKQQSSISGTYTGVEPMGLFWSMKFEPGQRQGIRLIKRDVTSSYDVTVSVVDGHVSMETLSTELSECLCQEHVLRWYKGKDVERREIRHGNIRATMFIPPGPGPHRGVIDIFGTIGGLLEYKASLLASRGFTTLALAWFAFEDLPKDFRDVDLKYFIEAVEWFRSQPEVSPSGVGIMAVSKGSDFALMCGMHCPAVTSVVSIGGTPFVMFCDMKFGDISIPSSGFHFADAVETDEGITAANSHKYTESLLFDYSEMKSRVLFLLGDDDGSLFPDIHEPALSKLTPEQRSNFTTVVYPRTGHLIEPPYAPVCTNTFHNALGVRVRWGGDIPYHAKAQEQSWRKIQNFFKENIPLTSSYTKSML